MRIEKCWFCSSSIYPGHGIQFVRNDATVFKFCRSKCHKNLKMRRNPKKVKWTKAYRHKHGMDMTKDKTFEYEKRRNRPMRYNRNVTEQTLKAIKKTDKIRVAREVSHIEKRWKGNAGKERREGKQELDQSIHMITAPSVLREEASKIKVPVSQSQTEDAKEEWSI